MKTSLIVAAIYAAALFANGDVTGNVNDPLQPELWANESLVVLEDNIIMGAMVYRDFENSFASYGKIVHTRKPRNFVGKRKTNDDEVTVQSAASDDIPVPLNQWIHVSFIIKDGEQSKSFKDLVQFYLAPALIAEATFLDRVICGQAIQFVQYSSGQLGQLSSTTTSQFTLEARESMSKNRVPLENRKCIIGTTSDTQYNLTPLFVKANERGDGGMALETARIGKLHGFEFFTAQNQPYVPASASTKVTGFVINGGNLIQGSTVLTVGTGTGVIATGEWVVIAGDLVPQRVTAHTQDTGGDTVQITIYPGLRHPIVTSATVTRYDPGAVNQAVSPSGYAVGYASGICYDNFTLDPCVGQPVNFGDGYVYCIVDVDTTNKLITLDQPLFAAIADDCPIYVGPPGAYNLAFEQLALALVCRPLEPPKPGTGALSSVVVHKDFAIRVTITYQGMLQGHLVTVDALAGVAVLDPVRGSLMLG